jgi:flavin reductase (DIM6/NTAB) family NADH-FMN oxidoreductase RutF/3,4-dihydroxy-2-butanone 4-phosphate synthase
MATALEQLAVGGIVGLAGPGGVSYLLAAGELVDAPALTMLVREGQGPVALLLLPSDCARLGLRPFVSGRRTAFWELQYESFEAHTGVGTGAAADDRARTVRVASDPATGPSDISKPGHITPLCGHQGGTIEAQTLVDSALDLVRLAGLRPAALVCSALGEEGRSLSRDEFVSRCRALDLPVVSVDEVVSERTRSEAVLSYSGRAGMVNPSPPVLDPEPLLSQVDTILPAPVAIRPDEGDRVPVRPEIFREVLGSVCTPVSVVTTLHEGTAHATTVSAFCSLSIEPPLVLVALANDSDLLRLIRVSRVFGINVLADQQYSVAQHLARKGPDKLAKVEWVEDGGLPRLLGSAGWLACRLDQVMPGGDHAIVTGLIVAADQEPREPLLYRQRRFLSVS